MLALETYPSIGKRSTSGEVVAVPYGMNTTILDPWRAHESP